MASSGCPGSPAELTTRSPRLRPLFARRPRSRLLRAIRRLLLAAVAVVVPLWVGLDIYLFAVPRLDHPTHTDAVIVLAGDRTPRLDRGLELIRQGVARTLVISDGHDPRWHLANRLCDHGGNGFRVICFLPKPY